MHIKGVRNIIPDEEARGKLVLFQKKYSVYCFQGCGSYTSEVTQNFHATIILKPQDSFGRFVKNFLDLQKVDHTIRKHH